MNESTFNFHFFCVMISAGDKMDRILLVEDNEMIVKGLKYSLEQEGFKVTVSNTLADIPVSDEFELMILDISLPDGSAIDVFADLKVKLNIPTIFLTAIDNEDTIVKCFELGADDYITKPFRTRELISRMNRLLKKENRSVFKYKDIEIQMDSARVFKGGEELFFTPLEYKILWMLFSNLNKIITREQILDKIYDMSGNFVNDNTLTVYIKRIREKLGEDIIKTVKGIGYRVDSE